MSRQRAIYLCGPDPTLREHPCPKGGLAHAPFPTGYGASEEYAAQLLRTGWMQHRCPACGLWGLWRRVGGAQQEMPPLEIRDKPYAMPNGPSCKPCSDGRPCPAVAP